ncbi:MAG: hypothetical protein MI810_19230 [Flavobacteriales bacterium]|jgi:F0F1-type ATP synthase assembly protein I|nr:hypothetical protein [Flavobacteriales bacterium]
MSKLDDSFIKSLLTELKKRLNRELTPSEIKAFSKKRSAMAYEMMLDFITDETKTTQNLEDYVASVVNDS